MMQASLNPPDQAGLKPCDLVMKGGITSGVVYPPAVLKLKDYYRFHQIGGTSAGAIAASFTAAAEFNRENGGFDEIQKLSNWLGTGSNLRNLFQASPETQPLMDILNVFLDRSQNVAAQAGGTGSTVGEGNGSADAVATSSPVKKPSTLRKVFQFIGQLTPTWRKDYPTYYNPGARRFMRWGIIFGVLLPLILYVIPFIVLFLIAPADHLPIALVFLISFLVLALLLTLPGSLYGHRAGGLVGVSTRIFDIITQKDTPKGDPLADAPLTFYGVCPGHRAGNSKGAESQSPPALTDWLHASLEQVVAGSDHVSPLTFGQLSDKGIELMMVTTNLSQGQPYVMPSGLKNFVFNEEEMSILFPDDIVRHMKNSSPKDPIIPPDKLPTGFYFLPDERDLPVILCTRMSLSFPLLLSAVPLYTVPAWAVQKKDGKDVSPELKAADLQQNWFSDGGLCSNFPIQFFDAWLPKHPTFGINLVTLPKESFEDQDTAKQLSMGSFSAQDMRHNLRKATEPEPIPDVFLPLPEDLQDPQWEQLTGLPQFLVAIFKTAQNYRDNMQASLPSYRERVVQIRLQRNEGGLNLNMPPEIIKAIVDKGQLAGEVLHNDFNFEHHWWVRFLVLMAQLELNLERIEDILATPGFEKRLEQEALSLQYPYYRDKAWCDEAIKRIAELRKTIEDWEQAHQQSPMRHLFSTSPPLPKPVLRVTPEI